MIYSIIICFGIFAYLIFILIFTSKEKKIMDARFQKYFNTSAVDEVQDQVVKEKHRLAKKSNSHRIISASKEFSNFLAMAGVKLKGNEFILMWMVCTFVPVLIVNTITNNILTSVALAVVGFAIPPVLVMRTRKKRQDEFSKQLGDSLVIMANSIKAGFSFLQAMESIATEMQPPISTEFAKALREIRYGSSLSDALKHMVDRVKSKDLDLLVSAVLTSTQVGGNLSDILGVISETVKERIKIKAEVKVLTSSGRTSGIIIGLLPVVIILGLMVINPTYFEEFFVTTIGKLMLGLSVLLEITGFAVINKIVDIKY